ncbi:uncharacterized protein LY79DRAFT_546318, partial [Colletotrichum navitas]
MMSATVGLSNNAFEFQTTAAFHVFFSLYFLPVLHCSALAALHTYRLRCTRSLVSKRVTTWTERRGGGVGGVLLWKRPLEADPRLILDFSENIRSCLSFGSCFFVFCIVYIWWQGYSAVW